MNKVCLNQTYKIKKTFEDYPEIKKTFDEITKLSIDNDFHQIMPDGQKRIKGRIYDDAVLFHSDVDFNGKLVCDLGARDGIYGAWLTQFVDKIYISDYFEEWGKGTDVDLGQLDYWKNIWTKCAPNPEKMVIETQDMTKLTYPDNYFDIVVSTSVIEHIYNQCDWQGDTLAMKEMARICKPGGIILLSTDMAKESKWVSGTYYYSNEDLYKRLIDPSGCVMRGMTEFSIDHEHNDAMTSHNGFGPVTSVVFSLRKPE
jgi:SAM-dependent methyltransferase